MTWPLSNGEGDCLGALTLCTVENSNMIYSQPPTYSSSIDEDSTHLRWYSIYDWEKSVSEWTHAFQTCAAEGVVHYVGVFSCLPFFELFSYSPLSAP